MDEPQASKELSGVWVVYDPVDDDIAIAYCGPGAEEMCHEHINCALQDDDLKDLRPDIAKWVVRGPLSLTEVKQQSAASAHEPEVIPDATRKLGEVSAAYLVLRLALQQITAHRLRGRKTQSALIAEDALAKTATAVAVMQSGADDVRDAARYRWLRRHVAPSVLERITSTPKSLIADKRPEALDAEVDLRIAGKTGAGVGPVPAKPAEQPYCRKCGGAHWVGAHDTKSSQGE